MVAGGVLKAKGGTGMAYASEIHIYDVAQSQWSLVRKGHANPAPRYAMSLVAWWRRSPRGSEPERDEGGGESGEEAVAARRPALCQAPTARSLLGGEIVMFGGLNRQYCDPELWGLEVDLQASCATATSLPRHRAARGGPAGTFAALSRRRSRAHRSTTPIHLSRGTPGFNTSAH